MDLALNNLQWLICHKAKPNTFNSKGTRKKKKNNNRTYAHVCECTHTHTVNTS